MDVDLELKAFIEAMKKNGCPMWMFERDEDGNFEDMTMAHSWYAWQEKAKAQVLPTWISVDDEWPPTDIMVLICWADAPDVTPEQDYMTIDEDLNSVWANYHNDAPSHWMHFHSVPNVSGAANE
ncbi:DUF551 domain-containing protein [Acinetobacter baumannii]|uniref:DUF551 domain-containing protein n=2 Tax=Acinetobacter baumannii TaxID=470 RepID=A0A6A8C542_ACIBA|nr:hypothetical protein [Acinetobacter baumannii]EKU2690889.1 hypothetical protein [Acinetobacter baumannii]EKU5255693.1 hypothetical protein [Acinetobacter baumannii]EKU6962078.1 hypothetical protein [Acinetobacter baumannii]EKU7213407.1 hypothetical protein [Acinetobacter baumannii]